MQSSTPFNLQKHLNTAIYQSFLRGLFATARGRAYVLTQAAIEESTDEGALFEHLMAHVRDPELARMVSKHAADEERHAAMFFACADRQGTARPEVPKDSRVLEILNKRLGLFTNANDQSDLQVMESYLLLQVIEERAVEQFALIEPVMREFDPATADVFVQIAKDEARHLKYCRAIVRRYAPSEPARIKRLAEIREAEAEAFNEHQQKGMQHLFANGYLSPRRVWFWRNFSKLLALRKALPKTRFFGEESGEIALVA
jgi:rubrerythrin